MQNMCFPYLNFIIDNIFAISTLGYCCHNIEM